MIAHLPLAVGSAAAIAAFNALPGVPCRLSAMPCAQLAQAFADPHVQSLGRGVFQIDDDAQIATVIGGDQAQVPATRGVDNAHGQIGVAAVDSGQAAHGCVPSIEVER